MLNGLVFCLTPWFNFSLVSSTLTVDTADILVLATWPDKFRGQKLPSAIQRLIRVAATSNWRPGSRTLGIFGDYMAFKLKKTIGLQQLTPQMSCCSSRPLLSELEDTQQSIRVVGSRSVCTRQHSPTIGSSLCICLCTWRHSGHMLCI